MRNKEIEYFLRCMWIVALAFTAQPSEAADGVQSDARHLIESYAAESSQGIADVLPKSHEPLVALGERAVAELVTAIESTNPKIMEHTDAFVGILGEIGSERAAEALLTLLSSCRQGVNRQLLANSLGACLPAELVARYCDATLTQLGSASTVRFFEAVLEKRIPPNSNAGYFTNLLSSPDSLRRFRERCRILSQPILG